MKIAIIGVTGLVGRKILEVLKEREFPIDEIIPVASSRSTGRIINYNKTNYKIINLDALMKTSPDLAIFCAGNLISKKWGPKLSKQCTVIDNSSCWRMDPKYKLIIPEINGNILIKNEKIIANPNCSTIQLLMVLAPLHKKYVINRVIVSTYQAVTGTGMKALTQLNNETTNIKGEMAYYYPIYQNAIPHCDVFEDNSYTKEEMKLRNETKKILDNKIEVSATAVRIPVIAGHSESVNISFNKEININDIKDILNNTKGVKIQDNIRKNIYPMPIYAKDKDDVFVGRIRRDHSFPNTINAWIVADNLRKGAATNTVQIAEYLLKNNLI